MSRGSNGRNEIEVSRTANIGNGATNEHTESFSDARWEVDDDKALWIIGQDGPIATFDSGFWSTVRVKAAATV